MKRFFTNITRIQKPYFVAFALIATLISIPNQSWSEDQESTEAIYAEIWRKLGAGERLTAEEQRRTEHNNINFPQPPMNPIHLYWDAYYVLGLKIESQATSIRDVQFNKDQLRSLLEKYGISEQNIQSILNKFEGQSMSLRTAHELIRQTQEWISVYNPDSFDTAIEAIEGNVSWSQRLNAESCDEPIQMVGGVSDTLGRMAYRKLYTMYYRIGREEPPSETYTVQGRVFNLHPLEWIDPFAVNNPNYNARRVETLRAEIRTELARLRQVCGVEVSQYSDSGPDDGFRARDSIIPNETRPRRQRN